MNIYQSFRNLIIEFIYGGVAPSGGMLALELVCLIGTMSIMLLPFYIVYRLIRRLL